MSRPLINDQTHDEEPVERPEDHREIADDSEDEPGPPFSAEFEADLDYVLTKNAELYRRLAL